MALVFKTKKGDPPIEIMGAGVVGGDALGGVLVEDAALVMRELQETDDLGYAKPDKHGRIVPLKGAALRKAAEEFAESRGLEVEDVSDKKLQQLREEAGVPAPRPPLVEIAKERYKQVYGEVPHEVHPEELSGTPEVQPPPVEQPDERKEG